MRECSKTRGVSLFLFFACHGMVLGRPQTFIASSEPPTTVPTTTSIIYDTFEDLYGDGEEDVGERKPSTAVNLEPQIQEFKVRSEIQYRYARTVVETYVKNRNAEAQELTFDVVLPNAAFVSNFSMLIRNQEYVAKVAKKREAQETFDREVSQGNSAGIVNQGTRDANLIQVKVNVEPHGKARFRLVYEELLERRLGRYEHNIHVNPGQVVKNFEIEVFINESLPLSFIRVPELKTNPNDITSANENPNALVERDPEDDTVAHIKYKPDLEQQKLIAQDGIKGQFIVQYDVDRKGTSGDIQVLDGYFVHYFAPDSLPTLPKHVVFVIDVSGSMHGEKLQQTKDAMVTVIDDMTEKDYFNILTFSNDVYHWAPRDEKLSEEPHSLTFKGTEDIKREALNHVLQLRTIGGTNINDGMLAGLKMVRDVRQSETIPSVVKPMIIFLTDGEATAGVTSSKEIKKNVAEANNNLEVPIYGLAFGRGADFNLIKSLSQENHAFARRIYEGSDAAIQLEDFYLQIASPKLSNVNIKYVGEAVENVTDSALITFNGGNELVVTGKINPEGENQVEVLIEAEGAEGQFSRRLTICRPLPRPLPVNVQDAGEDLPEKQQDVLLPDRHPIWPHPCIPIPPKPLEPRSQAQNFIERLWAFKSIKQLLKKSEDEKKESELLTEPKENETVSETSAFYMKKTSEEKALALSLRYNFVTSLTSLVVRRPAEGEEIAVKEHPVDPVPISTADSTRSRGGCPTCFSRGGSGVPSSRLGQPVPFLITANTGQIGSNQKQSVRRRPNRPTTTTRPPPPPPQFQSDTDYFAEDLDNAEFDVAMTSEATTSTLRSSCNGSISLHDKTYLRGNNVTIPEEEAEDLSSLPISTRLTSLEVHGDCCWRLFADKDYGGASQEFSPGKYESASLMGAVFRKVFSLRRYIC